MCRIVPIIAPPQAAVKPDGHDGQSSLLALHYWSGSQWLDAATTCAPPSAYDRHPDEDWLAVPICHLCEFSLVDKGSWTIYLPLVVRVHTP